METISYEGYETMSYEEFVERVSNMSGMDATELLGERILTIAWEECCCISKLTDARLRAAIERAIVTRLTV